ncbi:MAG: hypothetical protein Q9217_001170 [Psora testacea]
MAGSAMIGDPPANLRDELIIKGLYAMAGKTNVDPSKGIAIPPKRPTNPSHEDKGGSVVAGLIVAISVIFAITVARTLTKWQYQNSRLGWDDALIIVAAAGAITWFSIVIAMVAKAGVGEHIYNTTYEETYWFARYGYIDLVVFFITVSFTKLSIICFNWRLTGETSKAWKWVHRVFFVVVTCYLITAVFWASFRCDTPAAPFSLIVAGQNAGSLYCLSTNVMGTTLSGLHIAFDWMLLSIPIIILSQLKMATSRKLRAIIPLSVGTVSCIGSVMRQYIQLNPRKDVPWNFPTQLNWTTVDLVTSVCVTSLPALNTVITRYVLGTFSARSGSSNRKASDRNDRPSNKLHLFKSPQGGSSTENTPRGEWDQLGDKDGIDLEAYPVHVNPAKPHELPSPS